MLPSQSFRLFCPSYCSLDETTCGKEGADYNTYLLRLTEGELLDREQRAAQRRLKVAKFPVIKTLDTFTFAAQPSINRALVQELMSGDYIDQRENILFVGNPGTGKTHLATALGHAACSQGKRVRFFTVTGLVTQLLEALEDRQLQRFVILPEVAETVTPGVRVLLKPPRGRLL